MSLSMIIGPILGGLVYGLSVGLPYSLAGIFLIITFIIIFKTYKNLKPNDHVEIEPAEAI